MTLNYDVLAISGYGIRKRTFNIHNDGVNRAIEYYNELTSTNKDFNISFIASKRRETQYHKVVTVTKTIYTYPLGYVENPKYKEPIYWLRKLEVFKYLIGVY